MMDDFRPQRPGQPTDKPDGFQPQPAYNEQPETYEALPDAQATPEPTEPSPQTPKNKSGAKKWLLSGIVVLLLAGLGALAYWQWTEAQNASKEQASLQSELDAVKSANKTATEDEKDTDTPVPATKTDNELVKTEVEAYLASINANSHIYDPANVKMDSTFAVAKTSRPNTGANPRVVILEKSKENWVVIFSSSEPLSAAEKTDLTNEFGVTASLME